MQPTILVCTSPPGNFASHGDSPLNISSDSRVLNRISPIQMNSGSAVSVHELDEAQIVVTIASPTGRVVNSSIPNQATPISARPTQTPVPSRNSSTVINRMIA